MSAHDNLSPDQFVQQHADFHAWASSDKGNRAKTEARVHLEDTYSEATHEAIRYKQPFDKSWVAGPLHEIMDERHHPVVNDYLESRGN